MTRLLLAAIAVCAFSSVGCRHHNLVSQGCGSCSQGVVDAGGCDSCGGLASSGNCQDCQDGSVDGSQVELASHSGHPGHGGGYAPHYGHGSGHGHGYGHGAACGACGGAGCAACGVTWGGQGYGFAGLRNPQAVPRLRHNEYPGPTGPAGPSSASVGYPYYTTRGPRDFLINNPPSIGY